MRFISPLNIVQEQELRRYLSSSDVKLLARERKRFSCIFLSSKYKLAIKELSVQFDVSENSIKSWFNRYESMGCLGLLDKNMAHSQSSLATESEEVILAAVKQTPQNLKRTVVLLKEEHQIETNPSILKRFLKKKKWSWRRIQKSLKSQRDDWMHNFFKKELDWWLEEEKKGAVEVWFSDESSFHLNPNSMYGWQEKATETLKKVFLAANRSRGANILGFMCVNNENEFGAH